MLDGCFMVWSKIKFKILSTQLSTADSWLRKMLAMADHQFWLPFQRDGLRAGRHLTAAPSRLRRHSVTHFMLAIQRAALNPLSARLRNPHFKMFMMCRSSKRIRLIPLG